jgi:hypothetical protein
MYLETVSCIDKPQTLHAVVKKDKHCFKILSALSVPKTTFISRYFNFIFWGVSLGGVRLSPLGTSATVGLLYQPRMMDDDYGTVGGMRIGRGNRITRRKPAPVPLCPPETAHNLTWHRTRAAAVGSQRLTA